MNCAKPITINGGAFGCGQCIPCRVNRRRIWTHRIMLEAAQYEDNTFATLTYDDENLPINNSVTPKELQLFIKKLRKTSDRKLRYFACGEYGDQTFRPHYHLALFGFPGCARGISRPNAKTGKCCAVCDTVRETWGKGNISLGFLEERSAAYIAGYVTKKLTNIDNPLLEGRLPEFARMSLRPGIGLGMMHELASVLLTHKLDERMIDVPLSLQHGKKQWPLGRYLRRKLRLYIGREENTPEAIQKVTQERLREVREAAFVNSTSFSKAVAESTLGRRIQMEARERRFKKKGSL